MPIIEEFAAQHFTLNSISESRQEQVLVALHRFEKFLSKPLEQANDNDLRAWLVALLNTGLQPSTVNFYLRAVTPLYHWAFQQRLIDAEQFMRIQDVHPPRGSTTYKPKPYSRKELALLWEQLDQRFPHTTELKIKRWRNGTSPWRSIRKHAMRLQLDAIIELALVCGLRRKEIYDLSIADCHWDNKYIVVHGKRHDQNPKVREVPYPYSTRLAITSWFRMRGFMGPQPGLPLWLSVTGPDPAVGLRPERMATIMHSFGDWRLHRLRHTCATERLRAGMSLEALRDFLGHAHINQTLQYAQLLREDVHRASERTEIDFQRAIRAA